MDVQHFLGAKARRLKIFWYGGGLAVWAVVMFVTGLLLLLGHARQVEQTFIEETQATLRELEQALWANEQVLAAMTAFLETDARRDFAAFSRYVERLLQTFPQIRLAAILLLPEQRHQAPLELMPLAGPTLAQPVLDSLSTAIARAEGLRGTLVVPMPEHAPEQETFLLLQPLSLPESARLALLLQVDVGQALPTAKSLPSGMAVMARLEGPAAVAARAWWRVSDAAAAVSVLPTLRLESQVGRGGLVLAATSYQRLSLGQLQPMLVWAFFIAAALGLGLALAYGRSRFGREWRRREAELQLYQLANYDSLTGLPNRNLFIARLHRALTQARQHASGVALYFVDLDRFKGVNDSAGHDAGDRLLQLVAKRLQAAVRSQDTVARLSGDEFVVVMEGISAREDAERVVAKLQQCFGQPFAVEEHRFHLTASIGFATFPEDGEHPAQLLRHADARMYASKYADWSAAAPPGWLAVDEGAIVEATPSD